MSDNLGTVRIVDDVPHSFAEAVMDAFAARPGPRFSFFASGGDTARACYERLAAQAAAAIDWSLVDLFMGDERCVPPDDADANQLLVRQALIERVAEIGSFHPMSCDEGPATYQAVVEDLLAATGGIDLIHLGFGPDGHTASLFPGGAALDAAPDELVACTSDPTGRNPHDRMTLTLPAINRARQVVFTVAGAAKKPAWTALTGGADLPARHVEAAQRLWLVDRAAAGPG